jgi:hypothetical protein
VEGRGVVDSIAARRILDGVLRVLPSCNTEGHAVEVIDAWVEGENILCVTYRAPWFGGVLGYRWPAWSSPDETEDEVAMDIADAMGEPLGRSAGHLWLDDHNVYWTGLDPERAGPGRWVGRSRWDF